MIRLLALDVDGTLVGRDGTINEVDRRAIRRAEQAGVLVTIATGRRFRDAVPVARELALNAPVVTHNGALVKDAATFENLSAQLLPTEIAQAVVTAGKNFGGDALVSVDPVGEGLMLYEHIAGDGLPVELYLAWAARLHGSHAPEPAVHIRGLEDVLPRHQVVHLSFSGPCDAMDALALLLEDEMAGSVTIIPTKYSSRNFTLIDILAAGVSKAHGVEILASRLGISSNEVMAMGDNFNDVEMLRYAAVGVLMGNAEPYLLEQGEFYKTLPNDQGGVAAAIDRFIFSTEGS